MEKETEEKFLGKYKSAKNFVFDMSLYSSASILGPLLVFGFIGYFLDKTFSTDHLWLLICLAAAFLITNLFIFLQAIKIIKLINQLKTKDKEPEENDPADKKFL